MTKITVALLSVLFLMSCSDSDCIKCTSDRVMPSEIESCPDSDLFFRDTNGVPISHDEFQNYFESVGFVCEEG